jgi:hypothetical protein
VEVEQVFLELLVDQVVVQIQLFQLSPLQEVVAQEEIIIQENMMGIQEDQVVHLQCRPQQLQGQEMQEDLQYQKVIMVVKVITHRLLEQLVVVEVLVVLDKMVNLVIMVVMVEQVFQIQ